MSISTSKSKSHSAAVVAWIVLGVFIGQMIRMDASYSSKFFNTREYYPPSTEVDLDLHDVPLKPQNKFSTIPKGNAIVTSVVSTSDHYKKSSFFELLVCLKQSILEQNSTLNFHLIYGGGFNDSELQTLSSLGIIINNVTEMVPYFKSLYKPIYGVEEAVDHQRMFRVGKVHDRRDGWATYFKFLAWTMVQYERVLYVDADVVFHENPDRIFKEKELENVTFQAFPEKNSRGYKGLNTHFMLISPSMTMFQTIVKRAREGLYLPYTNTEQDVLEWLYQPSMFTQKFSDEKIMINHTHGIKTCRT
eukprot:Plantae.Rhodophyta-Hildenbrandia_rubra.ctg8835.p1 GENE.Plantae.Rhodophyta-Hildenbrandia_rubra.ctg8835~~Plantae.Rhodophyta-Hildenbrandia_rubra.ctg8835.p1  ORF type:complete len:304 (-),score=26.75 Plantae.Rhodophyta-Hildenbrandia_rubra.ctg8835:433-1344(-)